MIRLCAICLFCCLTIELTAAEIIFRNYAKVPGQWIRLSDVAKITGHTKSEKLLLKEIYLGPTPTNQEQKILTNDYLRRRLKQFGFWGHQHRVQLPEKGIRVLHSHTKNRLRDTESELSYLLEKYYQDFSRIDVDLEDPDSQLDELPQGLLSVEILDKEFLPTHSDRVSLMLEVRSGEKVVRGRFPAQVHLFRREVKTIRRLGTRLSIEGDHIELQECEVLPGQLPGYARVEDIVGMKVGRIIPPETRLVQGDVLPPIVIEKGRHVELIRDNNALKIQMYGKALDEARQGDEIKFEMPNGVYVKAKVLDGNRAKIIGLPKDKGPRSIVIGGEK